VECSFQKIDLFKIEPANRSNVNDTFTFNYNIGSKQLETV